MPGLARRTGRARWPGRIDPQVLEYVDRAAEDYKSRKGDLPVWRGPSAGDDRLFGPGQARQLAEQVRAEGLSRAGPGEAGGQRV